MGDSSTDRLVQALRGARAPASIISKAEAGAFHDFKSESATPIIDLVTECRRLGMTDIARRAIDGEFDATREEGEEWWAQSEFNPSGKLTQS